MMSLKILVSQPPYSALIRRVRGLRDEYFEGHHYFDIVLGRIDYSDPDIQDTIFQMEDELIASRYTVGYVKSWLRDFLNWVKTKDMRYDLTNGRPANVKVFYMAMMEWMSNPQVYMKYADSIVIQYGVVKASKLSSGHRNVNSDLGRAKIMMETRKLIDKYSSVIRAFPHSREYLFWEQYVNLIPSNLKSLSIVTVCILAVVYIFLGNFKLSLIVIANILLIDVDLLGMMYFWSINLNSVSLILMLISIGLAVDSCAHIAHGYSLSKRHGNCRVILALEHMGSSVFSGALTSFLGILPLGFATHRTLIVFFKFFFSMFLLSMFHGMAVLPVLLSFLEKPKSSENGSSFNPEIPSENPRHDVEQPSKE
eukprot:TRINITY_DN1274_c1_g2_i2.p1 TRINITY_DN1274_c1_g2~~TRINITY_DN1274_c1_g2_i2.p1  ORF type:complete len:367 (+),score=36.50 TRINITY_DN1274_c1_g2_i2:149-1249(+)